ncbi:MAG TPA: antibiotic biosynthesis monooxygenase family protein [Sphingobacteriaceae bacterium]
MITRIVKMTFDAGKPSAFEDTFYKMQPAIRNFEGCLGVELLKDINNPSVYFTISRWESSDALENYRASEFFKSTWTKVKPMFIERAQAWTLEYVNKEPR